jgi:hypothetical protein
MQADESTNRLSHENERSFQIYFRGSLSLKNFGFEGAGDDSRPFML